MRLQLSVCLAVALSAAGVRANAQDYSAGLDVGINLTSMPNAGQVIDQIAARPSIESSSKPGVVFGGFVNVPIADQWSLQPELQFVVKGVKLTESGSGGTLTASVRYLEIPVLMRYSVPVDRYKAYVMAGPTFALKAGTSANIDGASTSADVNIDPGIKSFDGGLAFAGGMTYHQYFGEVRYTLGLRDVGTDTYPHADALKNRAFAILAGIRLK